MHGWRICLLVVGGSVLEVHVFHGVDYLALVVVVLLIVCYSVARVVVMLYESPRR